MTALRSLGLAAALGMVALAGTARASDLPHRPEPYAPPAYQPTRTWTGAYVGAHVGGGFGQGGSVSTSGVVGGIQGGYNYQIDRFVLGGEADISASSVENKSFTETVRNNWLGSVRGRAGYLVDPNIMVYGTVGLGFGEVTNQSPYGKVADTKLGWALGAGAEYMMSPNILLRAEYLYYSLGSSDYPNSWGLTKIDNHVNVIRAGASYKF
jgi:outer membrane immunogenic protein